MADISELRKSIARCENAVKSAIANKIEPGKKIDKAKSIYDFRENKKSYVVISLKNSLDELKKNLIGYTALNKGKDTMQLLQLVNELDVANKLDDYLKITGKIKELTQGITSVQKKEISKLRLNIPYIPDDIKSDMIADIKELEKCFNSEAYRSAVILCGRLLEAALHRKYFEVTNQDILEKNPGIGLGTLIAKLREKNVEFEPGLTQQIHLINQVRISSVHKQQQAFYPNKEQAHAIILFTMDVLNKVF